MIEEGRLQFVEAVDLVVDQHEWAYATQFSRSIEEHWQRCQLENPKQFNGVVHVLREHTVRDGVLQGRYLPTDFASYLFWRDHGFNDLPTCDCFASVYLIGKNGGCLLAKSAPHTLNGGLFVAPGGLLDGRDVGCDDRVDVHGYALRELGEETGLGAEDVVIEDGYWIIRIGCLLAMGVVARSVLSDAEVLQRCKTHIAADADPELGDVIWWRGQEDQNGIRMPPTIAAIASQLTGQIPEY